ncbi:C40 family peptidase [Polaribacter porphyrae]|uniref:Glycoside hydrolase n=1 Tax=Polaribacter porphyrae TaxID=1137780 RepID=A0A2S7WM09_9FLAO|nr:C40 family peptidase [Polaribacter porphyrae]PQJ78655.1 glycoside hydrolase [Polaribacter porphyrae]
MNLFKNLLFVFIFISFSCNNNSLLVSGIEGVSESIQSQYAPDKRVAIYDIEIDNNDGKIIASGETNLKPAYQKLLDSLKSLDITFINKIRVLPDSAVGDLKYAIARNSVINIRSKPKHSAELGTQGLLGMPLKVLDKKGDFYRIQTPDKYISWVDKGGITKINKADFDNWNNRKKIIFTKNFGYVYADKTKDSKIISDITLGGILKFKGLSKDFFEVEYPDKRKGFVKREESLMYDSWLNKLNTSQENIEQVAKKMDGFPYLWGGTSSKGMDCSGFTKMVYLMNGYIIPRDASQQINAGKTVDKDLNFSDLQKGDLVFFGKKATAEKKQRVTHVGIWLGNDKMEFIHASGNVHLSSMDATQPHYDEMNKNRYLGSRRYLGVKDEMIVDLKEEN